MPRKAKPKDEVFSGISHICLIMDESGSMGGLQQDGQNLIDQQVQAAGSAGGEVRLTISYFGSQYAFKGGLQYIAFAEDPKLRGNYQKYQPNGGTPLLDGVGHTLTKLKKEVGKEDRALVIIFTDGYENASREWTNEKVANLIGKLEAKGNWSFTFTGAGLDAWAVRQMAQQMGFSPQSVTSSPVATPDVMVAASASYSHATSEYLHSPTVAASNQSVLRSNKKTQEELDKAAGNPSSGK